MSTELIDRTTGEIQEGGPLTLTGARSVAEMKACMAQMKEMMALRDTFLKDNMVQGINNDYAVIPGTKEKSLLKPGAEKLNLWHSFYAVHTCAAQVEDWDRGIFAYVYRCDIKQKGSNVLVGSLEGDCSTQESKYRFEWKWPSELPEGTDITQLTKKNMAKDGEGPKFKYQVLITNPADKRNTVRKMAQKRAYIGATIQATATSDLFTSKDPDEAGGTGSESGGSTPTAGSAPTAGAKDYGNPISDKQSKRLYAIRRSNNIDDAKFKEWLKAKYGLEDDRTIGYKIYEDICKACESGKLDMPKAEATPAEQPAPVAGATLSVSHIKALNAAIHDNKKTDVQFMVWLAGLEAKYAGRSINDILQSDFDRIVDAWDKALKAGAV